MIQGRVVGAVWATRRVEGLPSGALLAVEIDSGGQLVALDVLGCGIGERVRVATGSVAAGFFAPEHPPIDALVVGSIDPQGDSQ